MNDDECARLKCSDGIVSRERPQLLRGDADLLTAQVGIGDLMDVHVQTCQAPRVQVKAEL